VVQSTSYGGQVRGGSSRSDVLISQGDEEIDFPEVINADILLAMTQEASNEYGHMVKPDGAVILDATFVKEPPKTPARIITYPFTLMTKERLGSELPTNMVVLAVIARIGELGGKEALVKAIKKRSPAGKEEMNLQAFDLGCELVETGVLNMGKSLRTKNVEKEI
jgi:2-oxoglutarate ferredoxin oxidoreductase subunit gamma